MSIIFLNQINNFKVFRVINRRIQPIPELLLLFCELQRADVFLYMCNLNIYALTVYLSNNMYYYLFNNNLIIIAKIYEINKYINYILLHNNNYMYNYEI